NNSRTATFSRPNHRSNAVQAAEELTLTPQLRPSPCRRPVRPCRWDRGIAMRRHLSVGPLTWARNVGDFGNVRHQQLRRPAERGESSGTSVDPVGQPLGPARISVGKVEGAHDDDKLGRPAERVFTFYNQRRTAEQWVKEGQGAIKW